MNKLLSFLGKTVESIGAFIFVTVWGIAGLFSEKCEIENDCLKCKYHPIEASFDIIEIEVYQYNIEGIPADYHEKSRYRCSPISNLSYCLSDTVYNDLEKKLISECRLKMDTIMQLNGKSIGGGPNHNTRIIEYFQCSVTKDSIEQIHFPFEPQRRVYFSKENKNYRWGHTVKNDVWEGIYSIDCEKAISDTLPMEFAPEQWYLIDLSDQASQLARLYFRFKEDGEVEQYYLN